MKHIKKFGHDLILKNLTFLIKDTIENYNMDDLENKLMLVYFKQIKHYYEISCKLDVDDFVDLSNKLDLLDGELKLSTKEVFNKYNDIKSHVRNSIFYFDNYIEDKYKWSNK